MKTTVVHATLDGFDTLPEGVLLNYLTTRKQAAAHGIGEKVVIVAAADFAALQAKLAAVNALCDSYEADRLVRDGSWHRELARALGRMEDAT